MAKTRTAVTGVRPRRKPTITLDECFRLWGENDSFSLERASKDDAVQAFREWLFSESTNVFWAGQTPLDKIRNYETLGEWVECESQDEMRKVLPEKAQHLDYVRRWTSRFRVAPSQEWAESAIRSEEYRDLWIAAIAVDLQMEKRVGRVRAELRRLYPSIPPTNRKTDATGWLVIADWLQERDGEAVAVAIREAIGTQSEDDDSENDEWDAVNVRLVDEVTDAIEQVIGDSDGDDQEKASHLRFLADAILDKARMIDPE